MRRAHLLSAPAVAVATGRQQEVLSGTGVGETTAEYPWEEACVDVAGRERAVLEPACVRERAGSLVVLEDKRCSCPVQKHWS